MPVQQAWTSTESEPEPTKESNLWATTCARNCLATSASNSRSRFLVKVVASQISSSADHPQRMILPHRCFRRQVTEYLTLLLVRSSHAFS
jgi:hypothetical protein